jgi:GNAT superfamily N-acetyltransferase
MLHIRPLTEADVVAALRLSTQAGWNQLETDWLRLLRLFPGQCLGGCLDGQLIATATLATYGQRLGWVGMILVDAAHRRRGYGAQMLDAILALADRLGIATTGLDATDLGQPLYRKRGFLPACPINRWVGSGKAGLGPASDCATLVDTDWPDIFSLDQAMTGLDRSHLLRAIASAPGVLSRVVREHGQLAGFACIRPGRIAAHIGPLVARSSHAAQHLLECLPDAAAMGQLPILMDVVGGSGLEPIITARGFAIQRRLTRMYRPQIPPMLPSPACLIAAASFALG